MTLTVYGGPMASGKSNEMIKALKAETRPVLAIRPAIDGRDTEGLITSRSGLSYPAVVVDRAEEILVRAIVNRVRVVAIDEAHMFESCDLIVSVKKLLAFNGGVFDVVVSGLLYDWQRKPFEGMMTLAGMADEAIMLKAVCSKCGGAASWSKRLGSGEARIEPGYDYEPRCSDCWDL